ncbi:MAG: hypothetical protein RR367_08950 [Clostridia bacterium]
MQKHRWIGFLGVILILNSLFCVGYGLAESEGALHLYQGIPFEATTREAVEEALLEKTDSPVQGSDSSASGKTEIFDFGYPWTLQIDFEEANKGINRILLSSAQTARVALKDWPARLQSDLLQFIDVEGQLTNLYGEPDERFFFMESKKGNYMFPSGIWEIEQMLGVYQEYRVFHSFSLWGNVVLQTWVDSLNARYADKPLSRVMLYYYPDRMPSAAPIAPFPPAQEH